MMLTMVNLLLRFVGTSFQVYLSAAIGAAGVGLLQLVMSVGALGMVAGIGGIRTAAMYLTAEELGQKRPGTVIWVISGCILYSICFSTATAFLLYRFAPWIAVNWLGDGGTVYALRLLAAFLPVTCLSAVMTGYFTASCRIGTLAAVEVAEQFVSMGITMALLKFWACSSPVRACLCVIIGSGLGSILTLSCLVVLRIWERTEQDVQIPVRSRLLRTALPLAAADDLKSGITTVENLMVPNRLRLNSATGDPLAAFGMVCGMVFPVIMFPAAILFGLNELLIPELARCNASGNRTRIRYLVRRCLKIALLYGTLFSGLIFLLSDFLSVRLYATAQAGKSMQLYALLIPLLYCDAVTDAMIKGMGQQKICVRYNILTSVMDVAFLFLLLPRYGMEGYFFSFLVTHLINFVLSLRRLLIIAEEVIPWHIPARAVPAAVFAVFVSSTVRNDAMQVLCYLLIWGSLLALLQVVNTRDLKWILGLIRQKTSPMG